MRNISSAVFGQRNAISPIAPALLLAVLFAVCGSAGLTASTTTAAGNLSTPTTEPASQVLCGNPVTGAWTATANTGVVDEAAVPSNIYTFGPDPISNTSYLGFKSVQGGSEIVARYNVTNIFHGKTPPERPGWSKLELGSIAPPNSTVEARMMQVDICTGVVTTICIVINTPVAGTKIVPKCVCCQNFNTPGIDFSKFLYYVEVKLTRTFTSTSGPSMPRAYTLRVY